MKIDNIAIFIMVIIGICVLIFVQGISIGKDMGHEEAMETVFDNNSEGQRFYYEGNVFIGANDKGFIIQFEDLK
jgi:hypothetical protein